MKNYILLLISLCTINLLSAQMQATSESWFIIVPVKESAKADYEKWMTDIFFAPMRSSQDPMLRQQFNTARWQKPVRQNLDKTWTYSFFLDPAVPNADYGIESFLVKTYGETKGKTYMKQYESFMAAEGQVYFFETSKGLMPPSVLSEEEAIKKLINDEREAWVERDFNKWAEGWVKAPYITWTVTNGGEPGDVLTYRGWDSLSAYMSATLAKYPPAFTTAMRKSVVTCDQWNIQIRGNLAYVVYNQHAENAEKQTKSDSTETRVLEKVNGVWKLTLQSTLVDFKDATPPIRSKY
jgi:Domain of unknown function (DUF4440)